MHLFSLSENVTLTSLGDSLEALAVASPRLPRGMPDVALRWLLDTGSGHHIIPHAAANLWKYVDLRHVKAFERAWVLQPGRYFVRGNQKVEAFGQQMVVPVKFLMSNDSPFVLSVGALVLDRGILM